MSATLDEALDRLIDLVRDWADENRVEHADSIATIDARIDELQRMRAALAGWSPTEPGDWAVAREVARWQGLDRDRVWSRTRTETWMADQGPFTHEVMATVLGPQWVHVVALVRRAAGLTAEERSAYRSAWLADYETDRSAYDEAWRAVIVIGGPGGAARRAFWAFVVGVDYAGVAAALARRDEVDPKHYEVRTRVWRRMFGPIHPADEVLS